MFNKNMTGQELARTMHICLFCGTSDKYGAYRWLNKWNLQRFFGNIVLVYLIIITNLTCPVIKLMNVMQGSGVSSCHVANKPHDKKQQLALYQHMGAGFTREGSWLQVVCNWKSRLGCTTNWCKCTWQIRKDLNVQFIPPLLWHLNVHTKDIPF